jgi:LmbE family N-acetylglucosaminyl deacetylase
MKSSRKAGSASGRGSGPESLPTGLKACAHEHRQRWRFPRLLRARAVWVGLIVLVVSAAQYECYVACSDSPPEAYPVLALDGYERLLVVSPHCDDEALGAGGLIQAALREGLGVRVVIATAGDGYRRATMAEFGRALPGPADFIAMGELRQQESLEALARLGLNTSDVVFLTYPENGLSALWWDCWEEDCPYRSPYSGFEVNPYSRAFHPGTLYDGQALLQDLRDILAADRPDLIVMPHPNDEHTDHRALSAFVSLAVELERAEDAAFQPQMLGYLVHYGLYPQPFDSKPGTFLIPPRRLEPIGEWLVWRLSDEELTAKREAVEAYRSQQRVLGYFLNSFVRQNELFMRVDGAIPLDIVEGEFLPDADSLQAISGDVSLPRRDDPVDDGVVRQLSSGADIEGLRLLRFGDSLWVGLDLRGRVSRTYRYDLFVRVFTAEGSTTWSRCYGRSVDDVWEYGHTVWYRLGLDAVNRPDWLVLAAETRRGLVLDRTAWYVIHIEEGLLD